MADEDIDDEEWTKPMARYEEPFASQDPSSRNRQPAGLLAMSSSFTNSNTGNSNNSAKRAARRAFPSGSEGAKDDHSRTIVHIDLDCFYAQVEMVRNPALRTKPLGIQQKYLLVTCNYVARARGVTKLMRVTDALQRCPDLVIVSGEDLTNYRETSYRITELLHQFSPLVERLGFDENFVDVTRLVAQRSQGCEQEVEAVGHVYGESSDCTVPALPCACGCGCGCGRRLVIGSHIASEMREALRTQLGLTSCAGVAHNKLLAKLVGSVHKPDDQTMLPPHETSKLMGTLSKVTKVPGIGHSTGKRLASLGITTLNELIEAPLALLKDEFGYQTAYTMQRLCQGHDDTPVVQSGPPQSISDEDSFKKCGTLEDARAKIKTLLDSLLQRLVKDGRQPLTLRLSVRKFSKVHKWTRESRQCGLPSGILRSLQTDEAAAKSQLLDLCLRLFHKMVDASKPFHLTLINVCFAKFESSAPTASAISRFFSQRPTQRCQGDATGNETASEEEPIGSCKSDFCPSRTHCENVTHKSLPSGNLAKPDRPSSNLIREKTSHSTVSYSSSQDRPLATEKNDRTGNVERTGMDTLRSTQSGAYSKERDESGTDAGVSPRKLSSFFGQKSCAGTTSQTFSRKNGKTGRTEVGVLGAASPKDKANELLISENSSSNASTSQEEVLAAAPPNVDQSVFAELPPEVQQELLNEWKNSKVDPQTQTNTADPRLPEIDQLPGIDNSVFKELPPDVQDDVLRQYRHKRASSETSPRDGMKVKRPRTAKSPTKSPTKKASCKSRSITDFFNTESKK